MTEKRKLAAILAADVVGFGLLQIERVEAFGEPAVDRTSFADLVKFLAEGCDVFSLPK